jgi:copper resistance protein B
MMAPWWLGVAFLSACLSAPSVAFAQDPHAGHKPAPAKEQPAKPQTTQPQPEKPTVSEKPASPTEDHSAHMAQEEAASEQPREPIPPLTDADRAAAFPPGLEGHAVHDKPIIVSVLFDQLEWQGGEEGGISIDNKTWVGGDINRLWLRAEGESSAGRPENAQMHALYGRSISRWWDVVAGVRQDFKPGPSQTWLAVGIQGLAPQWFEVEATAYIANEARTHFRFEVEYELLMTNRLILQPLFETEIYGKDDPIRRIGAGLSSMDAGLRLRFEIRREFAPYVGIVWHRAFFGSADFAREDGEEVGNTRLAFGVRTWF